MLEQIVIRPANPGDKNFILNSWLKSYRTTSLFTENIPPKVFFDYHHKIAEKLLTRQTNITIVAACKEDPELIYGYAIYDAEPECFHYIYVKRSFNGFGIAKALIEACPLSLKSGYATHLTHKGKKIVEKMGLIYNPYLL